MGTEKLYVLGRGVVAREVLVRYRWFLVIFGVNGVDGVSGEAGGGDLGCAVSGVHE